MADNGLRSATLAFVAGLMGASLASAAVQSSGIIAAEDALPSAEGAYHGGTHIFLEGHARLTCSSHGEFTGSIQPPRRQGTTVTSEYLATFVGELSLEAPLVPRTRVFPIVEQAHMAERITLVERRGNSRIFETEMVALDLGGSAMPAGVMVRESPSLESKGRTTITALRRGGYRVESFFDVWLEISLDGGRTWHPAEGPMRMSIAPTGSRSGHASLWGIRFRYTRKEVVHHSKSNADP